MSRFTSNMSNQDKAIELADGSMGSLPVCFLLSGLSPDYLDILDKLNISGNDIYLIWNDVCARDTVKMSLMLVVALAGTFGVTRDKLVAAAQNRGQGIDVEHILQEVLAITSKLHPSLLQDRTGADIAKTLFEDMPPH